MKEVYEFLKDCKTYYLATVDGDQPRVRPFGTVDIYNNKLYIQTGKSKNVAEQISHNSKIEICAFNGNQWIRVQAIAVEDNDINAQAHMLDAYPSLKSMYAPGDGNTLLYELRNATATISSFTEQPRTIKF